MKRIILLSMVFSSPSDLAIPVPGISVSHAIIPILRYFQHSLTLSVLFYSLSLLFSFFLIIIFFYCFPFFPPFPTHLLSLSRPLYYSFINPFPSHFPFPLYFLSISPHPANVHSSPLFWLFSFPIPWLYFITSYPCAVKTI